MQFLVSAHVPPLKIVIYLGKLQSSARVFKFGIFWELQYEIHKLFQKLSTMFHVYQLHFLCSID